MEVPMRYAVLAKKIHQADYTAWFSENHQAVERHAKELEDIRNLVADLGGAAPRLWELGSQYGGLSVWATWDKPEVDEEVLLANAGSTRQQRYELSWRWAGAYLWAHGVKLTEAQAQALVHRPGKYNQRGYSLCGSIDWEKVEMLLRKGS